MIAKYSSSYYYYYLASSSLLFVIEMIIYIVVIISSSSAHTEPCHAFQEYFMHLITKWLWCILGILIHLLFFKALFIFIKTWIIGWVVLWFVIHLYLCGDLKQSEHKVRHHRGFSASLDLCTVSLVHSFLLSLPQTHTEPCPGSSTAGLPQTIA